MQRVLLILMAGLLAACQSPATATARLTPLGVLTNTPDNGPTADWIPYSSATFQVSLSYPPNWLLDRSGNALYSGPDGFFQITSVESLGPSAQAICQLFVQNIQTNPTKPDALQFGRQPTLEILRVDQQPACLLLPSSDQPASYRRQAFLAVEYPDSQTSPHILQFWADKDHIRALAGTLKFVRTP
jgi:TolB protein